jgi:membrane fusion protein, copper/silver efflux system
MRKVAVGIPLLAAVLLGFVLGHLHAPATARAQQVLYYVDPMHPSYRSQKPGIAPDCGMKLVPVYADDAAKYDPAPAAGEVKVNATAQQRFGIQLTKVASGSPARTVRAFGKVMFDETRVYRVTIGTDGYVKDTQDDAVGNHVSKDQHLATIYSPEFLTVIGGYLSANERTTNAMTNKENMGGAGTNAASAQARADRLRNLGMSDSQIAELANAHKIPEDIFIVSPTDGYILSRTISPGLRFEKHTEFYTIADLSHVWIIAEVFGNDAQVFAPGASAVVTLPDAGKSFHARVTNVFPAVDSATRATKVRLELDNPHMDLRPEMFVDVSVSTGSKRGITVPADALLDSGLSKRVFVAKGDGTFESREVQVGERYGDYVQIVKGLQEGETIVSSGTFLVDSEARLQSSPSGSVKNQ